MKPVKTLNEIRASVFASKYQTKVIGLSSDCTDEEFIKAAMALTSELHIKYDVEEYVINAIIQN